MNRRERRGAAQESRNSQKNPDAAPATLYTQGFTHLRAGRLIDAQICCQNALAIDPVHADSLFLVGLLAYEAGHNDHAVNWFARAIGQEVKIEYLMALGSALQRLQRFDEAAKAFDKVVQLKPDSPQAWKSLAGALMEQGRTDVALLACRHVLELDSRDFDAAYQCAALLVDLGRMEEALTYFNLCDELNADHASVLEKRGNLLRELKKFDDALVDHQRCYALNPANPHTCNNIGASLQSLHRDDEALAWFELALTLQANFAIALLNKALSLTRMGRFDEAIAVLSHATTIDPDSAQIRWNLSLLQLMTGDFEAGWAGREARWRGEMRPASYPKFSQPMWLGDTDLEGKTVLVQEDEGLGDTIQFARYIPMLAARGARVVLVVRNTIYPLLSGMPGVWRCIPRVSTDPLPDFDLHCPICDLPRAFGTRLDTIPSTVPYLPAPSENLVHAWRDRLKRMGGREKLRIGLVWSGNPLHDNDHNRSIPLQSLLRIVDADASFISLQKDLRAGDEALLGQTDIVDPTSHLTDFAETAALVSCLDLVVTVDTSVAHLAGALGRPAWVLIPYVPDYRWLLDRENSPWYPTMRLFRQSELRNWDQVLDRVRNELANFCSRAV
jgi:tetratricopeptide (TPR) repeat protein